MPEAPPPARKRVRVQAVIIQPDREVWLAVHGESFHQDELDALAGPKTIDGAKRPTGHIAILLAEPTNPEDPNAIAVQIDTLPIGYLPRDLAWTYLPVLELAARAGKVVACEAVVTGGWDRGSGDEGHYGVKLRLGSAADVQGELYDGGYGP